jgi:hypothetical protein
MSSACAVLMGCTFSAGFSAETAPEATTGTAGSNGVAVAPAAECGLLVLGTAVISAYSIAIPPTWPFISVGN